MKSKIICCSSSKLPLQFMYMSSFFPSFSCFWWCLMLNVLLLWRSNHCVAACVLHSSYFCYYLVLCWLCFTFIIFSLLFGVVLLVLNILCCCCLVLIMLFSCLMFIVLLLLHCAHRVVLLLDVHCVVVVALCSSCCFVA